MTKSFKISQKLSVRHSPDTESNTYGDFQASPATKPTGNFKKIYPAILSGLLTAYSFSQLNIVFIWVSFIPLFLSIARTSSFSGQRSYITGAVSAGKRGLIFGAVLGLCLFNWMVTGGQQFTGNSNLCGWVAFFLSSCFIAVFFAIITAVMHLTLQSVKSKPVFFKAVTIASLYCLSEELLSSGISPSFPWFNFIAGMPLTRNTYLIQPAAITGQSGLSFVVILVNYLLAMSFLTKKTRLLWLSLGVILGYTGMGILTFWSFKKQEKGKSVQIAILCENIPPTVKWDDKTGDQLAERLLFLSRKAVQVHPDIALWSESAIPWTYSKNDDLVSAILKNTAPGNITHLLGMNTATTKPNTVYNSTYSILPDGRLLGRYDKQILLSIIEHPFLGLALPFRSSEGFMAITSHHNIPLPTPYGKAGILICNESTQARSGYQAIENGATFLCNLSNDGWFAGTYLKTLHFYHARLRAVSCRKDIAVNSNMGYSGLINANGTIQLKAQNAQPSVYEVTASTNKIRPFASRFHHLPGYFYILFLIIALYFSKSATALKS